MSSVFPSRFLKSPEPNREDEILIGQIVTHFVNRGMPLYRIHFDEGSQRLRFRAQDDPVLYAVEITVRRTVAGGERCPLTMTAEIKNFLAHPRELLAMHERVPSTFPQPPGVKIYRQLNSVFASGQSVYVIDGPSPLSRVLDQQLLALSALLQPYSLEATSP